MLTVFQVESKAHKQEVRGLFWEYLVWANDMNDQEFNIRLDIRTMLEEDMESLEKFMPPDGRLLLAKYSNEIAGCICLKKLGADIGEIKRLYVRSTFRRRGVGKALVAALLDEARQIAYDILRSDSARYMTGAHNLYRSFGFKEIDPYPESEIPREFHEHWVFMEMPLGSSTVSDS